MSAEKAHSGPDVSVCIATYRRPEGLRRLLESLEAQALPEDFSVEIVVVDNDPPSAEPVVMENQACVSFSIRKAI